MRTRLKLTYRYLGRQFMGRHMVLRADGHKLSITNHQFHRLQRQGRIACTTSTTKSEPSSQ